MAKKEQFVEAFRKTFEDFGYRGLTDETIENAVQLALKGEVGENVLAMFIQGWLDGEYSDLKPTAEELFK